MQVYFDLEHINKFCRKLGNSHLFYHQVYTSLDKWAKILEMRKQVDQVLFIPTDNLLESF